LEVVETFSARAHGRPAGLGAFDFSGFSAVLRRYLGEFPQLAFCGTHSAHSVCLAAMNLFYRRTVANLSVVHGYDGRALYHAQRLLNGLPVTIVGVSQAVRERLIACGVRAGQIAVIENFIADEAVASAPRRGPFVEPGIRHAAVVGRLASVKRIDVLLACLEARPDLASITFHLFGDGPDRERLERRARARGLNVVFEGFRADVPARLATVDLLVHLRPDEPFGLVILEGMAAGLPVVCARGGGAGSIVDHGWSGLHFDADEPQSLGTCLAQLQHARADLLNALAAGGRAALETRFSETARIGDYRTLIHEILARPSAAGRRSGRGRQQV
jgi:glycosyltransferase involved in cell wall biosynthesis